MIDISRKGICSAADLCFWMLQSNFCNGFSRLFNIFIYWLKIEIFLIFLFEHTSREICMERKFLGNFLRFPEIFFLYSIKERIWSLYRFFSFSHKQNESKKILKYESFTCESSGSAISENKLIVITEWLRLEFSFILWLRTWRFLQPICTNMDGWMVGFTEK